MGNFLKALLLVLFVSPVLVEAQRTDFETGWHPGVIAFKDNSTIRGEINYKQKHEKIQVIVKGKKSTFAAHQLKFFQYYDKNEGFNRAFVSLDNNEKIKRPHKAMFEIVLEGALPYYRKPYLIEKIVVKHNQATSDHIISDFIEYDYFLYTKDGLVKAVNFGDNILPYMKKHLKSISNFIVNNKLDVNLVADQIQIVDHYNALEINN